MKTVILILVIKYGYGTGITTHTGKYGYDFDHYSLIECEDETEMGILELAYIKKFDPSENTEGTARKSKPRK